MEQNQSNNILSISDWIVILQNIISTTKDIHIFFGTAIIAGIAVLIAMNQIVQLDNPILNIILLTGVLLFFFIIMSNKNQKFSEPFRVLYNDIIHGKENNLQNILRRYEEIEEEIKKKEKRRNYMRYRFLEYLSGILGFVFIILGMYMYSVNGTKEWWNDRQLGLAFIPIGISIISIAIAIHSIILSKQSKDIAISSDKKMQSLTELNFVEKNAMLESYISEYTGNRPSIKKLIRDLEAAFQVVYWLESGESEINKNFIDALCRLTNIIITKDLIKNFDETDKTNYMKLLETAEQLKCDENKLKECKNNLEKKIKETGSVNEQNNAIVKP
jgi:hypothetical protein